ncbi:hypothetical protein HJC23_006654 [Cyclotella cryptica]|uniref:Glycosyltransferase 61 catalytic domain-containing protein n=1 Tax=Cyclotella cryptica TaxID=29204 RepID=A0ABD3QX65_9STRA
MNFLLNYYALFKLESIEDTDSFTPPQSEGQIGHNTTSNNTGHSLRHRNAVRSVDNTKTNLDAHFNFTIQVHDPEKDDPFATQKRKGQKWKSPFKRQYNEERWWKYTDSCFAVDNICRLSHNRWFYYEKNRSSNPSEGYDTTQWQPSFEVKYAPYAYRTGVYADTRMQLNVQSSHRVSWEEFARGSFCHVSSVPYHIVLQSLFNDMIGEFYTRTLMYVHRLHSFAVALRTMYESIDETHHTSHDDDRSQINHTQFYVHMSFDKPILDAHKLLLSGMHYLIKPKHYTKTNAMRWAKSAVDLVQPKNNDRCQCFQKLVFCGYDTYMQQRADGNATQNESTILKNEETNYTLWPGKWVDSSGDEIEGVSPCNPVSPTFTQFPKQCQNYAELKSFLLSNIEAKYSNIEENVRRHRREILQRHGLLSNSYDGDTKEWTIVGLAQRSSRRVWRNLSNATDACIANFLSSRTDQAKVICVEVNVEDTKSPHEQFLIHRSLNALIGVHGAQLTHGIFLRPGAQVLELLPWIPDYMRGGWTARTSSPTPLGIIFHNTDLNHYGYGLDRSSVPLCQGVSSAKHDKECLTSEENMRKFDWSERDFIVDTRVVIQFVRKFVLQKKVRICNDLEADAMGEFVLYNVWCRDDGNVGGGVNSSPKEKLYIRHFYREKQAAGWKSVSNQQLQTNNTICPLPQNSSSWFYYRTLVDTNSNLASSARVLQEYAPKNTELLKDSNQIPHRLIFTHKTNLLECTNSASNSTQPNLYTLAENVKATINAYRTLWADLQVSFLTDDDCIRTLNDTEYGFHLIPWYNSGKLSGMYKADLCRSAYLYRFGGYYFDVDILVVRPFVAPDGVNFITVKGDKFPKYGFFQAFMAAQPGNAIVYRSLKTMTELLWEGRGRDEYNLGTMGLMEAWIEVENVTNPTDERYSTIRDGKSYGMNGTYLLAEIRLNLTTSPQKYGSVPRQLVPKGHGKECQFSTASCDYAVMGSNDTLYFYSRALATRFCGMMIRDHGQC